MKEILRLKTTFYAFRAFIFRRIRQVECEHNHIKAAMLDMSERLDAYELELSKLPDPETTAVDLWLKGGEFDSSVEIDEQDNEVF